MNKAGKYFSYLFRLAVLALIFVISYIMYLTREANVNTLKAAPFVSKSERIMFNGSMEPPHPSSSDPNYKTVKGVDVDNNGVPDSYDRRINRLEINLISKMILKKYINHSINQMLYTHDSDSLRGHLFKRSLIKSCFEYYKTDKESLKIIDYVTDLFENFSNDARVDAYKKSLSHMTGGIYGMPNKDDTSLFCSSMFSKYI